MSLFKLILQEVDEGLTDEELDDIIAEVSNYTFIPISALMWTR